MDEEHPSSTPDEALADTNLFWRDVSRQLIKDSISSIDDTARQILVVTALLAGIYFHALVFSGLRGGADFIEAVVYGAPLFLFLLSLVVALLVYFPDRYRLDVESPKEGKEAYERVVTTKLLLLQLASLLLAAGIGAIIFALFVFLMM